MSRWFKSAVKGQNPMRADDEVQHLQEVEKALIMLLNDDISGADHILKQEDSSYHQLGRGISSFIASMLGVEKDLLKTAATLLLQAESKTWDDMKKAEKEPASFQSAIYPPGTEYALCYSIAMLTSAITAVLSGSITEAVKGFYKLRKAYITLDGILAVEQKYIQQRKLSRADSNLTEKHGLTVQARPTSKAASVKSNQNGFSVSGPGSKRNSTEALTADDEALRDLEAKDPNSHEAPMPSPYRVLSKRIDLDPEMVSEMLTHHTDIFIYSGSHLCFGLLLIVLSMVDNPVFNKILYIIGFKGDRERGVEMLWQATKFENFNSAVAGLSLLGFYNGLIGFCDILPTDPGAEDDLSGYPKARCEALLAEMRRRYPESKLWKLEEARVLSYDHNLGGSLAILNENSNSNMKQIAAINMFERSLTSMFYHDYEITAESWLKCSELNDWSPTIYYYMAGSAYVELYRSTRDTNPEAALAYKAKAEENIRKAPSFAGKQKVMSKQLPFDVYITRKVQKYETRAKAWDVDLIDAVGVSPMTEMSYLWNGIKKMSPVELEKSMAEIQWSRTNQPDKLKAEFDEAAIYHILEACILRNLGKYAESRKILEDEILVHDKIKFKGPLMDDWPCPSAHYEMACLAWNEKDLPGVDHNAKVLDCEQWLDKTQKYEAYVLDTRMGIKITTSLATVRRHKKLHNI
ncbi:mitochondrial outer membrane protein [Phlyctema vagabunda]|uniref:Inclusion body clearance protein IML2 n=1 Tax=Phlyctema vagabunda TaxID=108571 RepID=A0ABR4PBR4_9HELO